MTAMRAIIALMIMLASHNAAFAQQNDMMVRISEIHIHPNYLAEYTATSDHRASHGYGRCALL
jgi:hypothetical protein